MTFLLTSPLINEVAVVLLLPLVGWKITLLYVVVGMAIGMLGGWFLDAIHAERWLKDFAAEALRRAQETPPAQLQQTEQPSVPLRERHSFALAEVKTIVGRIWHWVLIGVGLGAALHGFVPEEWVLSHLGAGQWWTVPLAVLLGIPLYSNATAMVPIMESLLNKGLPIGTTLAFSMSTVAASFPEFILLKQVIQTRLLLIVFLMLLVAFTLIGMGAEWGYPLSILQHAAILFAAHGFAGMSMRALAQLIQQLAAFMEAAPHVPRLFQWLFLQPSSRAHPIMKSWYPHYRQVVELLMQLVPEQQARALTLQLFSLLLMCYASKEAMAALPEQGSQCDSPDQVADYVWSALYAQIKESAHV